MTRRIAAPLLLLIIVLAVQALAVSNLIPPPSSALSWVQHELVGASLLFVAVCAFLENVVVVSTYFPGSLVILFSMAATHGNPPRALAVFLTIVVASFSAHQLDYALGRWSLLRVDMRGAKEPTFRGALAAYWHPTFGSLYSFSTGTHESSYARFMTVYLPVSFAWNVFWGATMYMAGHVPGESGDAFFWLFCGYLVLLIVKERRAGARSASRRA
jgi:membrane protein DedA with SNARE-associated domain